MAHDHSRGPNGHVHGLGHNHGPRTPTQWQTPHLPDDHHHHEHEDQAEPDLDLVEKAFVEGFAGTSDPTSFLRLARIPFAGRDDTGTRLTLLRVEANETTDIGSITPHLGGDGFRYAPLPASLVGRRRDLAFVYHDGSDAVRLTLAEARTLADETPPR